MSHNTHTTKNGGSPSQHQHTNDDADCDVTTTVEVKAAEVDTRFGIGGFKPRGIQQFATVGWFTAFYSLASLLMSTIITYVNSQITTLERQFGFNSKQTGLIMAANDIGYLLCVLFVSHSAKMVHIPRALGFATIVFGVSGLVCSFPHFIYGSVFIDDVINDNATSFPAKQAIDLRRMNESIFGQLCSFENRSEIVCESKAGDNQDNSNSVQMQAAVSSLAIIVVGMMLQGFGKAPRASFSIIYIDDNTKRVKSGFYIGIMIALSIMGPAIAFAMGGIFSRMYVTLGDTNLFPKHPKWIGAWWLGFLVFGGMAVLVSIPLFCFPSKLPRKQHRKDKTRKPIYKGVNADKDVDKSNHSFTKKEPETVNKHHGNHHSHSNGDNTTNEKPHQPNRSLDQSILNQVKLFMSSLFRIMTNPIFVLMVCSSCFILFMVGGSSAYSPKYLERVFDMPAYKANYIMAAKTLSSSCVGTFIGGYLTKYYKMTAKKALFFSVTMSFVSFLLSIISMFAYCDQPEVYNWPGESDASLQTCHGDCHCEEERYFPICGGDGKTYYSPCTAGCLNHTDGSYSNCSCIEGGQATSGICPYGCDHVYFFAIVSGLRALSGTLCIIPKVTVIIRVVEERDKSLGLGVSSFLSSMLGWLLGPVVFGIIIDGICALWDRKCGVVGRCLLYDNDLFRWKLNGFSSMGVGGAFFFQLLAVCYAVKTGCLNDIGVDGKEDKVKDGKEDVKDREKDGMNARRGDDGDEDLEALLGLEGGHGEGEIIGGMKEGDGGGTRSDCNVGDGESGRGGGLAGNLDEEGKERDKENSGDCGDGNDGGDGGGGDVVVRGGAGGDNDGDCLNTRDASVIESKDYGD